MMRGPRARPFRGERGGNSPASCISLRSADSPLPGCLRRGVLVEAYLCFLAHEYL